MISKSLLKIMAVAFAMGGLAAGFGFAVLSYQVDCQSAIEPVGVVPCEPSLVGRIGMGLTLGALIMFASGVKIISDIAKLENQTPNGQKRAGPILLFLLVLGFLVGLGILSLGFYSAFFTPQFLYIAVYHIVIGFMMCIIIMMMAYEGLKKKAGQS